jgi:hypothetical protein
VPGGGVVGGGAGGFVFYEGDIVFPAWGREAAFARLVLCYANPGGDADDDEEEEKEEK